MENFALNTKKIILLIITNFIFLNSCLSFYQVPDEYIKDSELVFLKQKKELNPIKYTPEMTEPYKWDVDIKVNGVNPDFLKQKSFSKFLVPDFEEDAKLYLEVKEHLQYVKNNDDFMLLKSMLDKHNFEAHSSRKIAKGEKTKDFTNGIEYEYPEESGAKIVFFKDGGYKITFSDKRVYTETKEGNYFEFDSKGVELYAVFPSNNSYREVKDGVQYFETRGQKSIKVEDNLVVYLSTPVPQYQLKSDKTKNEYIFFLSDTDNIETVALVVNDKIRYDYHEDVNRVMASYEKQAIVINSDYYKQHKTFNQEERTTVDLISIFYPEGLKITDLDKKLSYSELKPLWPEQYISKTIGNFNIFYVKEDQKYLSKISSKQLDKILSFVKQKSNLSSASKRSIILPPNLESYRKLHAGDEKELLNWYPSGFQTKDIIIMWPPSVKRYDSEEGEDYFWNNEFYDIFLHELVHLVIGESTNVFSPIPVWLNEGMAVYIESLWSQETKEYWDITFDVSYHTDSLLSWDDVAEKSTSYFPVTKARVHYAQSYKMAQFLYEKYGHKKMADYIKSFKVSSKDAGSVEIKEAYRESFEIIFDLTWEENMLNFYDSLINES